MNEGIITIITTAITVGGTIIVAILSSRSAENSKATLNDVKEIKNQHDVMHKKLESIDSRLSENDLITCRLDLITALEHDPENIESILECARHYFLDLGGDFYVSKPFRKWAEKYNVDISEFDCVKHLHN